MSSCSVRWTPNFFKPMVRSLTQMPPSPFTSRTWNSTFSLCSCSGPPQMSHGCADRPGSVRQSPATGCLVTGSDGEAEEGSSACPHPPPGSTPGWVSADRHWHNTSLNKGGISESCWCIGDLFSTLLATVSTGWEPSQRDDRPLLYAERYHVICPSIPAGTESKTTSCRLTSTCWWPFNHQHTLEVDLRWKWVYSLIPLGKLAELATFVFDVTSMLELDAGETRSGDRIKILSCQRLERLLKSSQRRPLEFLRSSYVVHHQNKCPVWQTVMDKMFIPVYWSRSLAEFRRISTGDRVRLKSRCTARDYSETTSEVRVFTAWVMADVFGSDCKSSVSCFNTRWDSIDAMPGQFSAE